MPESTALAPPKPVPEYVQRYLAGESILTIAPDYGVVARTIYRWIMSEMGDEYPDLVTHVLVARIADADMQLAAADDQCQVARAREQARFARMDLERRRPSLYGTRPNTAIQVSGNGLQVQIVSYAVAQETHGAVLTPSDTDGGQSGDSQPVD